MTAKTLYELSHESCMLAGMIEGIDVLVSAADGHHDCPDAKRARNALPPMIEATLQRAITLNEDIERADRAQRS